MLKNSLNNAFQGPRDFSLLPLLSQKEKDVIWCSGNHGGPCSLTFLSACYDHIQSPRQFALHLLQPSFMVFENWALWAQTVEEIWGLSQSTEGKDKEPQFDSVISNLAAAPTKAETIDAVNGKTAQGLLPANPGYSSAVSHISPGKPSHATSRSTHTHGSDTSTALLHEEEIRLRNMKISGRLLKILPTQTSQESEPGKEAAVANFQASYTMLKKIFPCVCCGKKKKKKVCSFTLN